MNLAPQNRTFFFYTQVHVYHHYLCMLLETWMYKICCGFSCMIAVAFIGGALFVLQQFAGINGVLYFSSLTFQKVGVESSAVASLFVGLTNFAGLHSSPLIIFMNINFFWKSDSDFSYLLFLFRCTLCIILN